MIAALLLATLPQTDTLTDRCDEIERNHYFDGDKGTHVFTQIIFWEQPHNVRVLRAWRLDKGNARILRTPNGWRMLLIDGENLRVIDTHAPPRETWSVDDHELLEREKWPMDARVNLTNRPPKKVVR